MDTEKLICSDCNDEIELKSECTETHNGDIICQSCYDDNYISCEKCSEVYSVEDAETIRDQIFCFECADELFYKCNDCEKRLNKNGDYYYIGSDDEIYCAGCFGEHFFVCQNCDETFRHDDYGENGFCNDCSRENNHNEFDCKFIESDKFDDTLGFKRFFSVEIECLNSNGNYVSSDIFPNVEDGSMSANGLEYRCGILQGNKGLKLLKEFTSKLVANDYEVDSSCGLHVHIDCRDLKTSQLGNIAYFMKLCEQPIYGILPKSRQKSSYSKSLDSLSFNQIKHVIDGDGLENITDDIDRYHGFNAHALISHGTIEFRYHSGTINFEKIKNWILFCLAIVEYAKDFNYINQDRLIHMLKNNVYDLTKLMNVLNLPKEVKAFYFERWIEFSGNKNLIRQYLEERQKAELNIPLEQGDVFTEGVLNDAKTSLL